MALFLTIVHPVHNSVPRRKTLKNKYLFNNKEKSRTLSLAMEKIFLKLSWVQMRALYSHLTVFGQLGQEKRQLVISLSGDGANDVSMIQAADIGIGISGQEGMQVLCSATILLSTRLYPLPLFLLTRDGRNNHSDGEFSTESQGSFMPLPGPPALHCCCQTLKIRGRSKNIWFL